MTMSLSFPESSAEISSAFIETLVLIHRNFYRNLTIPVPLNQFATLMTLRLEKQATLSEIGQRLQISKQQMTNICDKLLHAGLITKRQDSEDRRRMLISMTSAGEKILDDQNELVRQRFLSSLRGAQRGGAHGAPPLHHEPQPLHREDGLNAPLNCVIQPSSMTSRSSGTKTLPW